MCLLCCQLAMKKACVTRVFDKLLATDDARADGSIVVVISPLTAIMKDQVSGTKKNKFSPTTLVNCCLTNLVWLYTIILGPSLFRLQTLLREVSLQHMSQDKLAMTT